MSQESRPHQPACGPGTTLKACGSCTCRADWSGRTLDNPMYAEILPPSLRARHKISSRAPAPIGARRARTAGRISSATIRCLWSSRQKRTVRSDIPGSGPRQHTGTFVHRCTCRRSKHRSIVEHPTGIRPCGYHCSCSEVRAVIAPFRSTSLCRAVLPTPKRCFTGHVAAQEDQAHWRKVVGSVVALYSSPSLCAGPVGASALCGEPPEHP